MRRAGTLSARQLLETEEREQRLRESRPEVPSSSVVPVRCPTCGHWNSVGRWICGGCGVSLR